MDNVKLVDIIKDAVSDYSQRPEEQTDSDWLRDYLGRKLPDRSVDTIHSISGEIIQTLDLMEEKKAAMENAIEEGKTAENWLAADVMSQPEDNGFNVRKAAEFFNGISKANADIIDEYEYQEMEAEDFEEPPNDYRSRDTLRGVAAEAGKAGLREFTSEVFLRASEVGIENTLADSDFMADVISKGAQTGLKTAVSAGLAIAEETGIIPPTTFGILAATAHKAVESASVIRDLVKGNIGLTDALVNIKNTAVSTFSGLWAEHKEKAKEEIISMAGVVFGPVCAATMGAVNGLMTAKEEEPILVSMIKGAAKATVNLLTMEIHIPFFSKVKEFLFG